MPQSRIGMVHLSTICMVVRYKSVIRNEGALCFCDFTQLTVEILNGVCGVNQLANLRRIFEYS